MDKAPDKDTRRGTADTTGAAPGRGSGAARVAAPATDEARTAAAESGAAVPQRGDGHRSPAEIEAQIERTRAHLAQTIEHIGERISPRNVTRRGVRRVKAQVVDEAGRLRRKQVAIAGAGVLVLMGLLVLRWRRSSRAGQVLCRPV
ncbi:DUF3618 domain-containing protein [Carbonactinospora thermoautotrophica]|uniref:DUF3618 domain-containing protein n=2 Tax=Carbonactinospora thermoautotrophica TaxID=1469144 RepID=A0A132MW99_9ACTN|nr:DUF3618 domain-containing protein [Carbonactinospora thermoautotrophica]KWX02188.1 hypothetical protein LI90_3230 [Carbonactinospora thermoautotrophica]